MKLLPAAFSDLEPYASIWALPTENQRSEQRWRSSPEDFKVFYDACLERLQDILDYLDQYAVDNIPDVDKPLFWLAAAFAEVAPHIELYKGSAEVPYSFEGRRFIAAHGNNEN